METENLNIYYHTKLLVLKALNKYDRVYEAARALGVSERTLYNYKRNFRIEYDPVKKAYVPMGGKLPVSLKGEIVKHLVASDSFYVQHAFKAFLASKERTDADFDQVLKEIREQILDCPSHMEKVLGCSYSFFSMITV